MRLDALMYAAGFVYDRILSGPDYDFIIINMTQIIIIVNMQIIIIVNMPRRSFGGF